MYNLGADPIYDAKKYGGELVRYQIDDQSPAKMMLMVQVCEDIAKYIRRRAALQSTAMPASFMVCMLPALLQACKVRAERNTESPRPSKYKSSGDKMAPGQTACVKLATCEGVLPAQDCLSDDVATA